MTDKKSDSRRKAEQLPEFPVTFGTLADQLPVMVFMNVRGRIVYVNGMCEKALGYSKEEFCSPAFDFMSIIAPEYHDSIRATFGRHLRGEDVDPYEYALIAKDGRRIEVINSPRLIEYDGEKAILGIVTDITERKQAEAALKESEEKYRTLVERASDGIVIIQDGRIRFVNRRLCDLYGAAEEQILGRPFENFIPQGQLPEITSRYQQRMAGQPLEGIYELTLKNRAGERFHVEINARRIVYDGRPADLILLRDIGERKRAEKERMDLERQFLHAQKLESLGVLAGGIAHDFNNLLMVILGNLDLAVPNLPPGSLARPIIEQAIQATRRATDLTRQMLAFTGRGHFMVTQLDLSELVRENADLFRTVIPRTVTMNLDLTQEHTTIEADPGQVQQVIMNLLTNAAEAIGEKPGMVKLTTAVRECDEAYLSRSRITEKPLPGRFVSLEVTDSGHGIGEEILQRIFDPFFTTKFKGRGLGLSAVLGIMRGHGGGIIVESESGRGAIIRVLFPALESPGINAAATPGAPAGKSAVPGPQRTILVVEDEETVRNLCLAYLQKLGFFAISAVDGEEALSLFEKHADEIALVLLDMTMPRMDGITTFRQMKGLRPHVKVILCSGYSELDIARRFSSDDLAGFLQKPYLLKDLREKIDKVLGSGGESGSPRPA